VHVLIENSILFLKKKEIEMKKDETVFSGRKNRRSFLRNGMVAAGAMTAGVGLVSGSAAFADDDDRAGITKGDIAILTFLSALEQVEADRSRAKRKENRDRACSRLYHRVAGA
jgi:hypothetical protein